METSKNHARFKVNFASSTFMPSQIHIPQKFATSYKKISVRSCPRNKHTAFIVVDFSTIIFSSIVLSAYNKNCNIAPKFDCFGMVCLLCAKDIYYQLFFLPMFIFSTIRFFWTRDKLWKIRFRANSSRFAGNQGKSWKEAILERSGQKSGNKGL